jgi:hypothetical protein
MLIFSASTLSADLSGRPVKLIKSFFPERLTNSQRDSLDMALETVGRQGDKTKSNY